MNTSILQSTAKSDAHKGTLILRNESIVFVIVTSTGAKRLIFDIPVRDLEVNVEGVFSKRISITDTVHHKTHSVKVANVQGWKKTIEALKLEV